MYGVDAMILIEVGVPTLCQQLLYLSMNNESLVASLDLISELKDKARIRDGARNLKAARRYNLKVKPRGFCPVDLMWRMHCSARKDEGKFSSNWERSFHVQSSVGKGVYPLETLPRKSIPMTWNATHLKLYFS